MLFIKKACLGIILVTFFLKQQDAVKSELSTVRNLKFGAYLKFTTCRNIHKINKVRSYLPKVLKIKGFLN